MPNDIVGHCSIAEPGYYCSEWLQSMQKPRRVVPAHNTTRVEREVLLTIRIKSTSERVKQLVEELGLENNRLLNGNRKVKAQLIETVAKYHEVFTTDVTKVGKTDRLSMKIVLKDNAVATRAHVRRVRSL